MLNILENFNDVKNSIMHAKEQYLLPANHLPNLIAVSKNHMAEEIIPLLEDGHKIYGENRIQEAEAKWGELKKQYANVELHLIGTLQSNKVKQAVDIFDVIEVIDRRKLADAIAKELQRTGKNIRCFVQVNIGQEEQKSGILPQDADEFIAYCREIGLPIVGLMCIPPAVVEGGDSSLADTGMYFTLLKKIAKRNGLAELSMGMSGDFELATALGATYVRVGTAIFGEREL